MGSRKMYTVIENDIQDINRQHIALPEEEVTRNNRILNEVLEQIVPKLKIHNLLFSFLYRNLFYGGSFFCGLKVGHPDEYDMDFSMVLPDYANPVVNLCKIPGFLQIELKEMKQWDKGKRSMHQNMIKRESRPKYQKIRGCSPKMYNLRDNIKYNGSLPLTNEQRIILSGIASLLDDDYHLDAAKLSIWFERIIRFTYPAMKKSIVTSEGIVKTELCKGGAAYTLKLRGMKNKKIIMIDIDLVPALVFSNKQWPPHPFRQNPVPEKSEFFMVPKNTGNFAKQCSFQPSFQVQENVLIHDLQNLKPCIRLLKRLRDVADCQSIRSYFIKTIFLWELKKNRNLWNEPLSVVFMTMLKICQHIFEKGVILNYWYENDNHIKGLSRVVLDEITNNFKMIVEDIELHPDHIEQHLNDDKKNNNNNINDGNNNNGDNNHDNKKKKRTKKKKQLT